METINSLSERIRIAHPWMDEEDVSFMLSNRLENFRRIGLSYTATKHAIHTASKIYARMPVIEMQDCLDRFKQEAALA